MKIQRYPGKAVDASLSLDRNNVMVELYEANWYQAHQNFGQPRITNTRHPVSNEDNLQGQSQNDNKLLNQIENHAKPTNGIYSGGSYLKDGVSTLNKYQINLEQVRALERQNKDESVVNTLKDLNGYKPSTLKRKSIRLNLDWNDSSTLEPSVANKGESQNASLTNGNATEKRQQRPRQQISIKPPSLMRSQTMVYSSRPAASSNSSLNNLGLKNHKNTQQHSQSSSSSSASLLFHSTPDEVSETKQTVISEQPQLQNKNRLSTTLLPANTCDSNLRRFPNDSQHSNAQPSSSNSKAVNRSKSVRFPLNSQNSHASQHMAASNCKNDAMLSLTANRNRSRKISLDIKQDLVNNIELLRSSYEKLDLNSPQTPTKQHVRQGSDSSTSSAQSSSASSKNSHKLQDHFAIPRPRLIVPVHTYARKRRTGNLKDQDIETINNEDDSKSLDGKTFWLNSFPLS